MLNGLVNRYAEAYLWIDNKNVLLYEEVRSGREIKNIASISVPKQKYTFVYFKVYISKIGASTLIWTEKLRSHTLDLKQMRRSNYDKARTPHIHARVQVQLYQIGKTKRAILNEYDLTPSSLDRWIH